MKKKDVRQSLTPQMKDYDNLKVKPLPYIMFLHQPNYSSASVNTDNHGLRISTDPEGVPLSINTLKERSCNLLVGGATAFGVGATSDKNTISGHLSTKTG